MGRLLNPGVGEITDRLTVLSLKILTAQDLGRPIDYFKTEQQGLLTQIRARTLNGSWFDSVLELAAVNAQIWHAEDQLRLWRASAGNGQAIEQVASNAHLIVPLAFRIQALNDRRAELVTLINTNAGEGGGEEKVR